MGMKDGSTKMVWIQEAKRNDLFVCECYQTLLVDLCDLQNLPEDEEVDDSAEKISQNPHTKSDIMP